VDLRVLSLRDRSQRQEAAGVIASGRPVAFFLGLFTIVKLLRPPWLERDSALFWRVKPERPTWSKLPMLVQPRHSLRLVDFAKVHPDLRVLHRREAWERLWTSVGAPLHVIAPLRRPLRFLHPAVATSPGDLATLAADVPAAHDRLVAVSTAACFWFDDPDWRALADAVTRQAPARSVLAGTSFNEHGAQPPYTLDDLRTVLAARPELRIDTVVTDERLEAAGLFGSHTMVRLPLVGEPPALVVTRDGSVGTEWLEQATGWPVRRLASTATAACRPGTTIAELDQRARARAAGRC
jgi:hypothetical protein